MKRRKFLFTASAFAVSAVVPIPAISSAPPFANGGIFTGPINRQIIHVNCRCVISPELAGARARHYLIKSIEGMKDGNPNTKPVTYQELVAMQNEKYKRIGEVIVKASDAALEGMKK